MPILWTAHGRWCIKLADLSALGFDLNLTGFDVYEVDKLLRDPLDEERAEQVAPLPGVAPSRLRDLWLLGPHRLLCGDATSADDVARLLGDSKPLLRATIDSIGGMTNAAP